MIVDEIPIDVTTEPEEDGGDDESTHVHVGITTAAGHHFGGSANAYTDLTPDEIASLIVRAALGAAAAHSNDTWIALQQLLATEPRNSP